MDYLHLFVSKLGWTIHMSTVLLRTAALDEVGLYDSLHNKHTCDFNLSVRLARKFEVEFVPMELVYIRLHKGQDTEIEWRTSIGTGKMGYTAERMDALAYLISSDRAKDSGYRKWLMNRLLALNAEHSHFAQPLLPNMYWEWSERLETSKHEINHIIPDSESFILIDGDQWGVRGSLSGKKVIPFPSRDGLYWGCPVNDAMAIEELKNSRQQGIKYVVFGWSCFWYFEYYNTFTTYLEETAERIYQSSQTIIFRLTDISLKKINKVDF